MAAVRGWKGLASAWLVLAGLATVPAISHAAVVGTFRNDARNYTAQLEYDGQGWKQYRVVGVSFRDDGSSISGEPVTLIFDCSRKATLEFGSVIDAKSAAESNYVYRPSIPKSGTWAKYNSSFIPVDEDWVLLTLGTISDADRPRFSRRALSALLALCKKQPLVSDGINIPIGESGRNAYFLMSDRFSRVGDMVDYWVSVREYRRFEVTHKDVPTVMRRLAINTAAEKKKLNVVADCETGKMGYRQVVDYSTNSSSEDPNPTLTGNVPQSIGEAMVKAACQAPQEQAAAPPGYKPPRAKPPPTKSAKGGKRA